MPVPLFDTVASTVAAQKLEALLQCKAEAVLKTDEVEPTLKVAGFFLPLKKDQRPSLFGDDVVAVLVTATDSEEKVVVYLRRQTGRQLAKRLRVSQIDDQAGTDEPSYFKKISKKTTLLVGSASEVVVGNGSIKYQSSITCQKSK